MRHRVMDGKGDEPMSAQPQIVRADPLGAVPSALVVLMAILAILGVIAHAAVL